MQWLFRILTLLLLTTAPAKAGSLVLLVDISSSIEVTEMHLQLDSYARLMNDMPTIRHVHIEVILFGQTPELIASGNYKDAALAFATYDVIGPEYRGTTCLTEALKLVQARLNSLSQPVIIDISGDGEANCYSDKYLQNVLDEIAETGARINTLYIDKAPNYIQSENNLRFYQSLTRNSGFTMKAEDFYDFELALFEKLTLELAELE